MVIERIIDDLRALSVHWTHEGHGILLRRVCELIHDNNPRKLVELISEVERSMPHRSVTRFNESTRSWLSDGGELSSLASHGEFERIGMELEAMHRKVQSSLESFQLSSRLSITTSLEPPPPPRNRLMETIELSATDLTVAEPEVFADGQVSHVKPTASKGNPGSSRDPQPPALPVSDTDAEKNIREQQPRLSTEDSSSPLPAALVIGALVMFQALIIFFCLFR